MSCHFRMIFVLGTKGVLYLHFFSNFQMVIQPTALRELNITKQDHKIWKRLSIPEPPSELVMFIKVTQIYYYKFFPPFPNHFFFARSMNLGCLLFLMLSRHFYGFNF